MSTGLGESLPATGFFFCAYAAWGNSTRAVASKNHLQACFISTPSEILRGVDGASCLKRQNCWGIRLTAKAGRTISCAISAKQRDSRRSPSLVLGRRLGARRAIL